MSRFVAARNRSEQGSHSFPIPCRLCNSSHGIRLCPQYRAKSPEERLRVVLIHKYCPNCLSPFHRMEMCSSSARCYKCGEKHHTTLHIDAETNERPAPIQHSRRHDDNDDDSDDALSIHLTEETKSWAQQVEEEELEQSAEDSVLPIEGSGGAAFNTFRPLLQHERRSRDLTLNTCQSQRRRSHTNRDVRTPVHQRLGSLISRPDSQQNWRQGGSASNTCRPSQRRNRHRASTTGKPYTRKEPEQNEVSNSLALQRAGPKGFRTGKLSSVISAPILTTLEPIAPTAIAKIESGGRLHLVRALIDPCSPNTTIDKELAREIQLERAGGGHSNSRHLTFRGKHGVTERISTLATVVEGYSRISPSTNLDPKIATPLQFMRLADPQFYVSSPIRLVIGADIYAKIMVSGTLTSSIGGLLLQPTIFGLVISGATTG